MTGADDVEVAAVQCCDRFDVQPFGGCDDRRINRPQREITILGDKLGDSHPVPRRNWVRREAAGGEVSHEANLRFNPDPCLEKVRHLRDHELGNDQGSWMGKQQSQTGLVIPVVLVDVGVKRPRIDEKSYRRASRRRICSIFRAVSRWPLLPALAAINLRRLPPRWDSMASRVTSDTVEPRRAAS